MAKLTKKQKEALSKYDPSQVYSLEAASTIVKDITMAKFDASVDLDIRLGVDPRKADQMVRGVVALPHGTGKDIKVLVLCTPDKVAEATEAGADYAGLDEYIAKAVREVKAGKIDFKVDKFGIIHAGIGKASFTAVQIEENVKELILTISRLKPSSSKGTYFKSIHLSSTMSPGIAVDKGSIQGI